MKAIPISIKEKYVCYVGHKIKTEAAYKYQPITNQVVVAMAGTEYDENRIITVNIEPDTIIALMNELGGLGEQNTGSLHLAMKAAMMQSINEVYIAEQAKPAEERDMELLESIGYLSEKIEERDAQIEAWRTARIEEGRQFFVA